MNDYRADNKTVFRWSLTLAVLGVLAGLLARDWGSVAAACGIGLYGWALRRGWIKE